MKYSFTILNCFKKNLKLYLKKFPHLKSDVIRSLEQFKKKDSVALGQSNYKIRIKSSDLKKGKSGGFRMILHVVEINSVIIPIAIYFKSEKENISIQEVNLALLTALKELDKTE